MKPARDTAEEWLLSNEGRIGVQASEMERQDQHCERFHAWYDTDSHILDITCWNHGPCLDVFALNKQTGDQDFGESGECTGEGEVEARLERLISWHTDRQTKAKDSGGQPATRPVSK